MNEIIFDTDSGFSPNHFCETGYLNKIVDNLDKIVDEHSIIVTMSKNILPKSEKDKKIIILTSDEFNPRGLLQHKYPTFRTFNTVPTLYDYKTCFPIPLGYNSTGFEMKQMYPDKPTTERKYDFVFSSQAKLKEGLHQRLNSIKNDFNCIVKQTGGFRQGYSIDEYYQLLGESKISFAAVESFRYFESLASGCITILIEDLEEFKHNIHGSKVKLWYYENAPIIRINSWRDLNVPFLKSILNQQNINEAQKASLNYYKKNNSPEAVANYIKEQAENFYKNN